MTQRPLVSIITPAFNRANLLAETIESVLDQDYPNLEYIVLDDGSTDDTRDVLARYEGRLRHEWHPNMGETRTVNKGFSLARGEIIGVVNSDDPLLPGALTKLVNALMAHPDVVVAYPDWLIIDGLGRRLQPVQALEFTGAFDMIRRHHCLPGPGALFRRSVVEKTSGRDPTFRYTGDLDFWFRAVLVGPFLRVPETLATFRVHDDSTSVRAKGRSMAYEHMQIVENFFSRTDLPEGMFALCPEAQSSASFVAGCSCSRWDLPAKLRFFLDALRLAPAKYIGEYVTRWPGMVLTLAGFDANRLYLASRRWTKSG
jgi:glycosyltransferase involved in cell wall biosynthesis